MNSIIIKGKKNYIKNIGIIILMIVAIYILVIWLRNPSDIDYYLLPTEMSVIIFSLIGIISSLFVIYLFLRNLLIKNHMLKIDDEGIYSSYFVFRKKTINWKEIDRIKSIRHNRNNYIGIFLKEYKNNERGIKTLLYNLNKITMGTPYIIYSGDLDCTFKELENVLAKGFKRFKRKKP